MTTQSLPFSPACERNKEPILIELKKWSLHGDLLEIGHGTGQHACYFSRQLPQLRWHASDVEENNWMLKARLSAEGPHHVRGPFPLRVQDSRSLKEQLVELSLDPFHSIFSANTLHIMNEEEAELFCKQVPECLKAGGLLFLYGPFRYRGEFIGQSNELFHQSLVARGVGSGIREFYDLEEWLSSKGVHFVRRSDLPANNQLLVFQK